MSSWLHILPLESLWYAEPIAQFAQDAGEDSFDPKPSWFGPGDAVASLNMLNLASITFFLDHVARLEGLSNGDGIHNSKWTNLPYWIYSIWLPVKGPPRALVQEMDGIPTLFGTTHGLLSDLAEIDSLSTVRLNIAPPHYQLMRQDMAAFLKLEWEALSEEDTMRWVWRSLFDAAHLANEHDLPLASA